MNQHLLPNKSEIELALGMGKKARNRRWLRQSLWGVGLLAALAGGYYLYQERQAAAAIITYETVEAVRRDLTVSISATGTIQPLTQVDVGSELSGVAREVLVDENAIVKAGDVLARLDATRLTAQQARATAQLESAKARVLTATASLNQATLALTRQTRLRARSLSTEQDIEQADAENQRATANVAAARADVAASEADLALVNADLEKAVIVSPINGIVLKRTVEPGQTVAASLQAPILFTIAQDISRIQLEANVDEADVGVVKVGQSAAFTVDAYRDRSFPAKIERMSYSPETVDGVVTYKTILSADNSDLSLRPGMTATAKVVVAEFKDVLTVPNEALRYAPPRVAPSQGFSITQLFMPRFPRNERGKRPTETDGRRSVYVLSAGNPQEVRVKTGATDGKITIIQDSEIKAGDALVTATKQATAR